MPFDASPVESEVVTVLKKARALIDSPEKWGQGELCDRRGALCIRGAIIRAMGYPLKPMEWMHQIEAHIPGWEKADLAIERAVGENPVSFNNDEKRTHSDVMEAFDRAIILAGGTP